MRDLNRLPTKTETIIGAIVALVVSVCLGWALYFLALDAADHSLPVNTFYLSVVAGLALIFGWSSALFIRTIFGTPQLPSFRAQRTIGWAMVLGGALLAVAPFLPMFKGADTRASLRGLAAFTMGLTWVYQARSRDRA